MKSALNRSQSEFKALMEAVGWSAAETARRLDVSRAAISQILSGKSTPAHTLQLLRHKVAELLEARRVVAPSEIKDAPPPRHSRREPTLAPVISWASAGDSHAYEDQGYGGERILTMCRDPNCYVLEVEGESMEPKYEKGDLLIVTPRREAQNGDLVVARTIEDAVFFKRYHRTGRHSEIVKLTSYNPVYPAIELELSEMRFVHPIHSVLKRLIKGE